VSARTEVVARIKLDQPTWAVKGCPWVPKQVAKDKPAVAVWLADLEPGTARGVELQHNVTVNLYLAKTADEAAEDEAEAALDKLLTSLQRLGKVTWTKAERMVFDNVISGWQITCAAGSNDIYRQAVLAERG